MPKIGSCKILVRPNFKGDHNILMNISTINMHKFIKIRHDTIKQYHGNNSHDIVGNYKGNYKEIKTFNYKLKTEIFRNSTLKNLGVLRGSF